MTSLAHAWAEAEGHPHSMPLKRAPRGVDVGRIPPKVMGDGLSAIGYWLVLFLAVLPSCRLSSRLTDPRLALLAHPVALFPFGPHPSRGVGVRPGIVDVVLAVGSAGKGAGYELVKTVVGATATDRIGIET
jgi:hypothetical protein